ncbi:MAG: cupin domain-containing protein [Candidatus Omnitrophica bacterium]|nr:cupin domain-containing protein [Candidatus Omnitrophota bacterium]
MIWPRGGFFRLVSFTLLVTFLSTSVTPAAYALRQEANTQSSGVEELTTRLKEVARAAGWVSPETVPALSAAGAEEFLQKASAEILEALESTDPVASFSQLFPKLIEEASERNVSEVVPQALLATFRSLPTESEKRRLTGSLGQAMMIGLHEFSEDFRPDPYPRVLPGRRMIWTVTTSPTIDLDAKKKLANWFNRKGVLVDPDGGGINIAVALAQRGVQVRPVFFYVGETGKLLVRLIENRGVFVHEGDAIELKEDEQTRVTIITSLDKAWSLVPKGPPVSEEARRRMVDRLLDPREGVQAGDIVVISGSLAPGLPESFYADLGRELMGRGAIVVTDTKGAPAKEILFSKSAATTIYSQNNLEFAEAVGVNPNDRNTLITMAKEIINSQPPDQGIREIVITEGASGAFSVTREKFLEIPAPKIEAVSEAGAGDTSLAERVFRAWQGKEHDAGFVYGVAAGTASVLHPGTGGGLQAEVDHFAEELGLTEETKVKPPQSPAAGVEESVFTVDGAVGRAIEYAVKGSTELNYYGIEFIDRPSTMGLSDGIAELTSAAQAVAQNGRLLRVELSGEGVWFLPPPILPFPNANVPIQTSVYEMDERVALGEYKIQSGDASLIDRVPRLKERVQTLAVSDEKFRAVGFYKPGFGAYSAQHVRTVPVSAFGGNLADAVDYALFAMEALYPEVGRSRDMGLRMADAWGPDFTGNILLLAASTPAQSGVEEWGARTFEQAIALAEQTSFSVKLGTLAEVPGVFQVRVASIPGTGLSMHIHPHGEIYLAVIDGSARVQMNSKTALLQPGVHKGIPAGTPHGIRLNPGTGEVRVVIAHPVPYDRVESSQPIVDQITERLPDESQLTTGDPFQDPELQAGILHVGSGETSTLTADQPSVIFITDGAGTASSEQKTPGEIVLGKNMAFLLQPGQSVQLTAKKAITGFILSQRSAPSLLSRDGMTAYDKQPDLQFALRRYVQHSTVPVTVTSVQHRDGPNGKFFETPFVYETYRFTPGRDPLDPLDGNWGGMVWHLRRFASRLNQFNRFGPNAKDRSSTLDRFRVIETAPGQLRIEPVFDTLLESLMPALARLSSEAGAPEAALAALQEGRYKGVADYVTTLESKQDLSKPPSFGWTFTDLRNMLGAMLPTDSAAGVEEESVTSPDGVLVARVKNAKGNFSVLLRFAADERKPVALNPNFFPGAILAIRFSLDGRYLLVLSRREKTAAFLRVWDISEVRGGGETEFLWGRNLGATTGAGFSTDGEKVHSTDPSGQTTWRSVPASGSPTTPGVKDDETVPASGMEEVSASVLPDRNKVSVNAGGKTATLSFDMPIVEPPQVSPDRRTLLVRTSNRNLYAHDLSKLSVNGTAPRLWNYGVWKADAVRFSDDSRQVLVERPPATKRKLSTLLVLDARTGKPMELAPASAGPSEEITPQQVYVIVLAESASNRMDALDVIRGELTPRGVDRDQSVGLTDLSMLQRHLTFLKERGVTPTLVLVGDENNQAEEAGAIVHREFNPSIPVLVFKEGSSPKNLKQPVTKHVLSRLTQSAGVEERPPDTQPGEWNALNRRFPLESVAGAQSAVDGLIQRAVSSRAGEAKPPAASLAVRMFQVNGTRPPDLNEAETNLFRRLRRLAAVHSRTPLDRQALLGRLVDYVRNQTAGVEEKKVVNRPMNADEAIQLVADVRQKKPGYQGVQRMRVRVFGEEVEDLQTSDVLQAAIRKETGSSDSRIPVSVLPKDTRGTEVEIFIGPSRSTASQPLSGNTWATGDVAQVMFDKVSSAVEFLEGRAGFRTVKIHLGDNTLNLSETDQRARFSTLDFIVAKAVRTDDSDGLMITSHGEDFWVGAQDDPRLSAVVQAELPANVAARRILRRGIPDWWMDGELVSSKYGTTDSSGDWSPDQWIQRILLQPFGMQVKIAYFPDGRAQLLRLSDEPLPGPKTRVVTVGTADLYLEKPPEGFPPVRQLLDWKGNVVLDFSTSTPPTSTVIQRAVYQAMSEWPVRVTLLADAAYVGEQPRGNSPIHRIMPIEDVRPSEKGKRIIPGISGAVTQILNAKVRWLHVDSFGTLDRDGKEIPFTPANLEGLLNQRAQAGRILLTILGDEAWVSSPAAGVEETQYESYPPEDSWPWLDGIMKKVAAGEITSLHRLGAVLGTSQLTPEAIRSEIELVADRHHDKLFGWRIQDQVLSIVLADSSKHRPGAQPHPAASRIAAGRPVPAGGTEIALSELSESPESAEETPVAASSPAPVTVSDVPSVAESPTAVTSDATADTNPAIPVVPPVRTDPRPEVKLIVIGLPGETARDPLMAGWTSFSSKGFPAKLSGGKMTYSPEAAYALMQPGQAASDVNGALIYHEIRLPEGASFGLDPVADYQAFGFDRLLTLLFNIRYYLKGNQFPIEILIHVNHPSQSSSLHQAAYSLLSFHLGELNKALNGYGLPGEGVTSVDFFENSDADAVLSSTKMHQGLGRLLKQFSRPPVAPLSQSGVEENGNVSFAGVLSMAQLDAAERPLRVEGIQIVGNPSGDQTSEILLQQYDASPAQIQQSLQNELGARFGTAAPLSLYSVLVEGPQRIIRPAVWAASKEDLILAIELGGTMIRAALVNSRTGEVLVGIPDVELEFIPGIGHDHRDNAPGYLAKIRAHGITVLKSVGMTLDQIGKISVSTPGILSASENGLVELQYNLPFTGMNLRQLVAREFGVSGEDTSLWNDMEVGIEAEAAYGLAEGRALAVYMTLSTGTNAAYKTQNGKPVNLELGGYPAAQGGKVEDWTSGPSLARLAQERIGESGGDRILQLAGGDSENIRGEQVGRAFKEWQPLAVELFEQSARVLGPAIVQAAQRIAAEVDLTNESEILWGIGGSVAEGNRGTRFPRMIQEAVDRARTDAGFTKPIRVIFSKMDGSKRGPLGAAAMARAASGVEETAPMVLDFTGAAGWVLGQQRGIAFAVVAQTVTDAQRFKALGIPDAVQVGLLWGGLEEADYLSVVPGIRQFISADPTTLDWQGQVQRVVSARAGRPAVVVMNEQSFLKALPLLGLPASGVEELTRAYRQAEETLSIAQ